MATSHLRIGATYAKLVDAAADPATVAATSFDPHVEIDSIGSASEYTK